MEENRIGEIIFGGFTLFTCPSLWLTSKTPGLKLSFLVIISVSLIALFLIWFGNTNYKKSMVYYLLPGLLFIEFSVFYYFKVILINQKKIREDNITEDYYKYDAITTALITINCLFYYYIYGVIIDGESPILKIYLAFIILMSIITFFVSWTTEISLSHFSADG